MGLLDDAIREHLELKRRRGADPGEIARLEQEALGPARREPVAAATAYEDEHAEEWHAHEGSEHYDDEPLYEDVQAAPPAHEPHPVEPATAEHEPVQHDDQPTQQFSLSELEDAHEDAPPPPEPAEHPELDEPPAPPSDHHEPEVVPADEEPGEDDVLEETPEFLQETPEHDRLWFEQKPPRDFDF